MSIMNSLNEVEINNPVHVESDVDTSSSENPANDVDTSSSENPVNDVNTNSSMISSNAMHAGSPAKSRASNKFRAAFVNGPFLPDYSRGQRSPAVTRSGTLYYPMWLAYAAAHAERLGCEILLLDAPASKWDEERTLAELARFMPDFTLVETATPSIDADLAFASRIKVRAISTKVVVGGTHASALPWDVFTAAPLVDAVFVGEYEIPLEETIQALRQGHPLDGLEGVLTVARKPSDGAVQTRTRFWEDLDARPFVSEIYKRFLPIERYFNPNAHHPMVAFVTGRGCPFGCSYCVFPQTLMGRRYRKRSIDSIIAEMSFIAKEMPTVRGVFLEDDTFTADAARVRVFCERLVACKFPLTWSANARAEVDRETLSSMKRAGVRALCVGFESGNQGLLDAIGKGLRLDRMELFAREADEVGVKIHGCFMVGLPGETRVTLWETLQFAMRLPLDTAQFYPLMVYPGTRAYEQASAEGRVVPQTWRDWLTPEGLHRCVVRVGDLGPGALSAFCNLARRRFYLRKSWLARMAWRSLTDRDERRRLLRSASTFLRHLWSDR
ncbi:MAG: radical SAM protein [Candidatus Ozemobacteraceae bacterium]